MRRTSGRRRADHGPARKYRGKVGTPSSTSLGPLARPKGEPGTIACPDCGTTVPVRDDGRPELHSPGGWSANGQGKARCYASGNPPPPTQDERRLNLPVVNEATARANRWVTLAMAAGALGYSPAHLGRIMRPRGVEPVALLDGPHIHPFLYSWDNVSLKIGAKP